MFLLSLYYCRLDEESLVSIEIKGEEKYEIETILDAIDSRKKC